MIYLLDLSPNSVLGMRSSYGSQCTNHFVLLVPLHDLDKIIC